MTEKRSAYKLYNLSDRLSDLEEMLSEMFENAEEKEIFNNSAFEEFHQAYLDLLSELDKTKEDFNEKVDSILSLIQSRKRWIETRKLERERLSRIIKKDEKLVEELSTYLLKHLEKLEIKSLKTKRFNVNVRKSSQAPLILNFEDKSLYPDKYLRKTVDVNKKLLKEDIKKGDKEALKYGHLGNKTTYISIR